MTTTKKISIPASGSIPATPPVALAEVAPALADTKVEVTKKIKATPAKMPAVKAAARKAVVKQAPAKEVVPKKAVLKKVPAKATLAKAIAPSKLVKTPPAAVLKTKKPKLVRDSFTIPKAEYVVLEDLKQRAVKLTRPAKKSELLRAAIKALAALSDAAFLTALAQVPALKTGRPMLKK
jgi:hypothetical protein